MNKIFKNTFHAILFGIVIPAIVLIVFYIGTFLVASLKKGLLSNDFGFKLFLSVISSFIMFTFIYYAFCFLFIMVKEWKYRKWIAIIIIGLPILYYISNDFLSSLFFISFHLSFYALFFLLRFFIKNDKKTLTPGYSRNQHPSSK